MLQVLTAIQAAFNANATLSAAFANGLETALGKDAEGTPTCILAIVGTEVDYATIAGIGSKAVRFPVEMLTAQFTVYNTSADAILTALDTLNQVFDHQPLTLSTERWLDTRRAGMGRITAEDERIFRGDVTFKFTTQMQLGS